VHAQKQLLGTTDWSRIAFMRDEFRLPVDPRTLMSTWAPSWVRCSSNSVQKQLATSAKEEIEYIMVQVVLSTMKIGVCHVKKTKAGWLICCKHSPHSGNAGAFSSAKFLIALYGLHRVWVSFPSVSSGSVNLSQLANFMSNQYWDDTVEVDISARTT
jgi:hypothetical protein